MKRRRAAATLRAVLAIAWALPCTALGALFGLPWWLTGGRARRVGRTVEVAMRRAPAGPGSWRRRLPFAAITFGHLIVGTCPATLERLRLHEQAHVRQYERWGPLFLLAYPLASAWAWARGEGAYLGNRFEREARAVAARTVDPRTAGSSCR